MVIEKNKVVGIHYKLTDENKNTIDNSEGREPLLYIQGIGNLIPGLEKELEGKSVGEKLSVIVSPKDAYGDRNDELVQIVPKSGFQSEDKDDALKEGMQVQIETNQGKQVALVAKVEGEDVTLDLNHPLAGIQLHFDVEIMSIRNAEKEELEHGHAHGVGGHQH